ncbi:MAG: RHS-related protein [Candidatus Nomurabacteria bacterium]|nr:RHS-related protein [Candidatus Nomurabacteria bacterium]
MKKLILALMLTSGILYSYADTCTDISINLSKKGNTNSQVLILQNFLFNKGLLNAKPNGYFGPQTFTAVKLYQKSKGITPTGDVAALTRSSIKNESCNGTTPAVSSPTTSTMATTTSQVMVTPLVPSVISIKVSPSVINTIDYATFISGGKMDTPLTIRGSGFSSSTNQVILKLTGSNRTFDLGNFPSVNGTTTIVSSSFITNTYPCGTSCTELLPVGNYSVIVKNEGGESNAGGIIVRNIIATGTSGSISTAIKQQSTQAKLATFTIGTNTSISLEEMNISLTSSLSSGAGISNLKLKDELSGEVIGGSSSFDLGKRMIIENQSKIYSLYGDIDVPVSVGVTINAVLKVKEFIGNNFIYITIPTVFDTISG